MPLPRQAPLPWSRSTRRSSASASVLLRKAARPVAGPTGASGALRQAPLPWPRARTPALVGFRLRLLRKTRGRSQCRQARCLTYHTFASLKRGPSAKTRRSSASRLRFASQTRGRSLAPPGPACSPRQAPLAVAPLTPRRSSVLLRKNARPVIGPARPDVLTCAFASLKRGPQQTRRSSLPPPFCSAKRAAVAGPPETSVLTNAKLRLPCTLAPRRSSASASVCSAKTRGRSSAAGPMFWPHAFASLKRGPSAKTPGADILPRGML